MNEESTNQRPSSGSQKLEKLLTDLPDLNDLLEREASRSPSEIYTYTFER